MSSSVKNNSKLSRRSYIGTRDLFPPEMRLQRWLFETQRGLCHRYGYEEYAAPLLESLDLYRAKSSEEIVKEQLYSFLDRGERELAIRPEMTPSLARMVSLRQRELPRPIRWFSIANFMRYERPGHGRLREFFQLNVDLLGTPGAPGNAEVLSLAADILAAYGAQPGQFQIRYSDRRLLESYLGIKDPEHLRSISRIIDKRAKLSPAEFDKLLEESYSVSAGNNKTKEIERLKKFLSLSNRRELEELGSAGQVDPKALAELTELESLLKGQSYKDALLFDPTLVRGFDYYTGFIFEIYDSNPKNRRSLLGGGRYDRLLELLGVDPMPAVGFGMGDVTLEQFLRTHGLIPPELEAAQGVFLVLMQAELREECFRLGQELRSQGIPVEQALDPSPKLGRQFEIAQKKGRRFAAILGSEELEKGSVSVKDLSSGKQEEVPRKQLGAYFKKSVRAPCEGGI